MLVGAQAGPSPAQRGIRVEGPPPISARTGRVCALAVRQYHVEHVGNAAGKLELAVRARLVATIAPGQAVYLGLMQEYFFVNLTCSKNSVCFSPKKIK